MMEKKQNYLTFPDLTHIFKQWGYEETHKDRPMHKQNDNKGYTPKTKIITKRIQDKKRLKEAKIQDNNQQKMITEENIKSQEKCKTQMCSSDGCQQKHENSVFCIEILPVIKFDIKILPILTQKLYQNKVMLRNTELLINGAKFVSDLNHTKLLRWEKALVIYQVNMKKVEECHFGLLLKYKNLMITYDGKQDFWPIASVKKSYHWQRQTNSWSCGYIAMFWATKILQYGLDKWVIEQEP